MIADMSPVEAVWMEADRSQDDWLLNGLSFSAFNANRTRKPWLWDAEDEGFVPSTKWRNFKVAFAEPTLGTYEARYSYSLGKFSVGGSYMHDTKESNPSDRDGWAIGASYLGANLKKPGSYGLYLGFRELGRTNILGSLTNVHGFEAGANYAFSPSLIGSFRAFRGKDSVSDQNVKAGAVELTFYF